MSDPYRSPDPPHDDDAESPGHSQVDLGALRSSHKRSAGGMLAAAIGGWVAAVDVRENGLACHSLAGVCACARASPDDG